MVNPEPRLAVTETPKLVSVPDNPLGKKPSDMYGEPTSGRKL